MSRIVWENFPQIDRRLVELRAELAPLDGPEMHREAARTLTDEFAHLVGRPFTEDQVRNRLKRKIFDALEDRPITVIMPYYQRHEAVITSAVPAPEKRAAGMTLPEYLAWMREGRKKTLILSDLHIPMQDDAVIQYAVERNAAADLLVLNGDVTDAYALSTFAKMENVPIYAEVDGVVRLFEWLSTAFPDRFIVITQGNHEARVAKRILPVMPEGLAFLANTDILGILARPFPNIVVLDDWFVQVGDAIYAHAEAASGVAAKPAVDTLEWFINHREELGLAPFHLVVQAHTHRISVVYRGRYKAVESGCVCHGMGYARTTRHKHPQQQGFVVTVQQDGRLDPFSCREFPLAQVDLPSAA